MAKQVAESVVRDALVKAVSEVEDLPSPPRRELDPRSPPRPSTPRPSTPRPRTPTTEPEALEEIELRVLRDACTTRSDTVNPVALSQDASFATCLALGGALGDEADDMGETADIEHQIETLHHESERQAKTTESESSSLVDLDRPPWWQRWCCCFFRRRT